MLPLIAYRLDTLGSDFNEISIIIQKHDAKLLNTFAKYPSFAPLF